MRPRCSRKPSHGFEKLGIKVSKPKVDLPGMMKHKTDTLWTPTSAVSLS